MQISLFGEKYTQNTGILELMDDMGRSQGQSETLMLGGGNPAQISKVNRVWKKRLREILKQDEEVSNLLALYDSPQGKVDFLKSFAAMLHNRYGWAVTQENIMLTNGSQNAFFLLFNFLSGDFSDGTKKKICLPLVPEYIGYADQTLQHGIFTSRKPKVILEDFPFFKYYVDFEGLQIAKDIGALCSGRPTNPTGNVLTQEEVCKLSELCKDAGIPFILDNAYGLPFPGIIFNAAQPFWNDNTILSMSLSKLGLPAVRTGILVASKELIAALSKANAIQNLAAGGVGPGIVLPYLENGLLVDMAQKIIQPYYMNLNKRTVDMTIDIFANRFPYRIHRPQGSIFLWLHFPELPITSKELYQKLKEKKVLVVPGEYFFFGMQKEDDNWKHRSECIRLNYAAGETTVKEGLKIIAAEVEKLYARKP